MRDYLLRRGNFKYLLYNQFLYRGRHLKNGSDPIVILIFDLDSCSGVEYHFLTRKRMKKILKGRKVLLNQKVLAHHEYRNFR